jgi:hypothetical protein
MRVHRLGMMTLVIALAGCTEGQKTKAPDTVPNPTAPTLTGKAKQEAEGIQPGQEAMLNFQAALVSVWETGEDGKKVDTFLNPPAGTRVRLINRVKPRDESTGEETDPDKNADAGTRGRILILEGKFKERTGFVDLRYLSPVK